MKKILTAFFILLLATASAANTAKLPDIDGWTNGDVRETAFDAVSGNKGTWLERDYRTSAGVPFHAIWLDGAGQNGWKGTADARTKSTGAGAAYKGVKIAGCSAILEYDPVIGRSLAIKVGKLGTLTLESNVAEEAEIIKAAETLINKIQ